MHHPLLSPLLWGEISRGLWGESSLLKQRSRNPQGTPNLCFGSLGQGVADFFLYNAHFEINTSCSEAFSMNQCVRKGSNC